MTTTANTVRGRIDHARTRFTPTQLGAGILLVAALGVALLVAQDPMMHDAMHNFRHAAGITCH